MQGILRLLISSLALLLFALPFTVQAQDEDIPPQIDTAFDALSEVVSETIAFQTLSRWDWERDIYPTTALGCPREGEVYSQVQTAGYQFLLSYGGTVYDYRVSEDEAIVILCTTYLDTVSPTPPDDTASTNVGECPTGRVLPIEPNETARTTPGLPSNLRADASLDAEIRTTIPPERFFVVTGEPVCGDGYYWFPADFDGTPGWVAQGVGDLFYITDIPDPLPETETLAPITPTNIGSLQVLSRVNGNVQEGIAWSPDGVILALASINTDDPGVWLYDVTNLDVPPRLVATEEPVTATAFGTEGLLVTGDGDGTITLWNVVTEEQLTSFETNDGAILSLRFNPTYDTLVVVNDQQQITFWGVDLP